MNEQYCFWIVLNVDEGYIEPNKLKNFHLAKELAHKLSKNNPGRAFVVLQSVCHVITDEPVFYPHIEPEQELPF